METVDDLTITYEEGDRVIVEQLEKEVLSKGAWATVLYKYRELDRSSGDFGAPKFTLRRYQKRKGVYRQQSKFNISSRAQAKLICDTLLKWLDEE